MVRIKSPQDLGAGVMFIVIGLLGLYFGQDLAYGSAARMGPGYFPIILSGLIALIGLLLSVRGLALDGPAIQPFKVRPLFVILITLLTFVFLIDIAGLVITTMIVAVMASFGRTEMPRLVETAILAVAMAGFAVLVFVYGLQLPMQIWWGR